MDMSSGKYLFVFINLLVMQPNETWLELKAKTFKVFADPTRLRILEVLREGEFNVSAIMEKLGLKQSTVSQHLRMLKECGVVTTRKEGREIYYSLKSDKVIKILDEGDELLAHTIEELTSCVCP
jgi:ArsR family transcriptional regulator